MRNENDKPLELLIAGLLLGLLAVVILVIAITPTRCASAQAQPSCFTADPHLMFNTSSNCVSQPSNHRVFGSQQFTWQGVKYLAVNTGNDIRVFNPNNTPIAQSGFEQFVGHVADSDYDLLNFSVCDDCRYGVANYKKGAVLFEMGTGAIPVFGPPTIIWDARFVPGSFTFAHDGQQYLIAADLVDGCSAGNSTIYEFNGTAETGLVYVGCVDVPGKVAKIVGGYHVEDHLYLGDKSESVHIFSLVDLSDGSFPDLVYVSSPMRSYMIKDKGLSIDFEHKIAVEARNGAHVWDISDPAAPVKMSTIPGVYNRSAVKWPLVFVARTGMLSDATFDISDLSNPIEIESDFWATGQPDYPCSYTWGGAIIDRQRSLYVLQYSIMWRVDTSACEWPAIFIDGFETGNTLRWDNDYEMEDIW